MATFTRLAKVLSTVSPGACQAFLPIRWFPPCAEVTRKFALQRWFQADAAAFRRRKAAWRRLILTIETGRMDNARLPAPAGKASSMDVDYGNTVIRPHFHSS